MPRRSPRRLRAGAPAGPRDAISTLLIGTCPGPDRLALRVRLRGETVVWSDLMYPGADNMVVDEVRFRLDQYLGEIERARTAPAAPP
ncbi:hypothetical protein [Streptomyces erythrochromogenes]|uniref:hypothetical protein n=1 Tax=Streptomyces erythrochromogenes TaxID=285574 RepID=UPI0038250A89